MVLTFATKADIWAFAVITNPSLTLDDVSDALVAQANAYVRGQVYQRKIYTSITDTEQFLFHATVAAGCEELCRTGKITWTTGDLASVDEGMFKVQYQKWQPMFFFAKGAVGAFYKLLPHETWRMLAGSFIDSFADYYTNTKTTRYLGTMFHDRYKRGYGAENEYEHWL